MFSTEARKFGGIVDHKNIYEIENRFRSGADLDRRRNIRFPLEMELTYHARTKPTPWSLGRSVNISSSGVLIRTDEILIQGVKIRIALRWPNLLDNRVPLQLVAKGRVVWAGQGYAAVEFFRSEFKTAREPKELQKVELLSGQAQTSAIA